MPEQESNHQEDAYSEIPDETMSVEDYGARMSVKVWYSPIPLVRTKFSCLEIVNTNNLVPDEPWVRQEKIRIITAKAILLGLNAISQHKQSISEPEVHNSKPIEFTMS